jgi:hypothetical protein
VTRILGEKPSDALLDCTSNHHLEPLPPGELISNNSTHCDLDSDETPIEVTEAPSQGVVSQKNPYDSLLQA